VKLRGGTRATTWLLVALSALMAAGPFLAAASAVSPLGAVSGDPPNIPSSLLVAVAYDDTERSGGIYTADVPAPWCGSPGIQFIGASTIYNGNSTDLMNCLGGDWDGGAILVTNTGSAPITLTGLTVTLPLPLSGSRGTPSCAPPPRPIVFNLWFGQQYFNGSKSVPAYFGGPITLKTGGQAIFAGTTSDGTYVCPSGNHPSGPKGTTYDFDTSDSNFLTGCTRTNDTVSDPQITFTANGYETTTYLDQGHVIDTGGFDAGMCKPTALNPEWPNEDLGWRLLNSTCGESCPTNQFLFSPNGTASSSTAAATTTTTVTTTTSSSSSRSTVQEGSALATTTTVTVSGAGAMTTTIATTTITTGVSVGTAYAIAAVAAVFIIATGYLAVRVSRKQQQR
jgi:hypothetical protein